MPQLQTNKLMLSDRLLCNSGAKKMYKDLEQIKALGEMELDKSLHDLSTDDRYWMFPHITPREVQLKALNAAIGNEGYAYFMRMRLGKTLTVLSEFEYYRRQGELDWLFVVCPNSIKLQWKEEIENAKIDLPILVYNSQTKQQIKVFILMKRKGILIVNYDSLKVITEYSMLGYKYDRAMVVLDESTAIKSPKAKRTKAAIEFAVKHKYKRILTGKPIANSNADLWAQFRAMGTLGKMYNEHMSWYDAKEQPSFFNFQNLFTHLVRIRYGVNKVLHNRNNDLLQKMMAPYCYIAEDKYIEGFSRVYMPLRRIGMKDKQRQVYKKMEKDFLFEISNNEKITATIILTLYLRLQQIGSGFISGNVNGKQELIRFIPTEDNMRIKETINIVEREVDNKVIIVARFRESIAWLKDAFEAMPYRNYKPLVLQGNMKLNEVQEVKKLFNESYEHKILIAQIDTLQYGHTLPGMDNCPCDCMIFYENNFSLIARSQSEARPEKVTPPKTIAYFDFSVSNMDTLMIRKLRAKEDAAMGLLRYARKHGIFGNSEDI